MHIILILTMLPEEIYSSIYLECMELALVRMDGTHACKQMADAKEHAATMAVVQYQVLPR